MQIILDIQRLEIIPIDQEPYSSVELQNINKELFALNNKNFVKRAPAQVVKHEKNKKVDYESQLEKLKENLNALKD